MIKLLLTSCCIAALSATPTAQASEPSRAETPAVSEDMRAFGQLFSCYKELENAVTSGGNISEAIEKFNKDSDISPSDLSVLHKELEARRDELDKAINNVGLARFALLPIKFSTLHRLADTSTENRTVFASYLRSLEALNITPRDDLDLSTVVMVAYIQLSRLISAVDKKLREARSSK